MRGFEALDPEAIQVRRRRILPRIGVHMPRESLVARFAQAREAEFERMRRDPEERRGSTLVERALRRGTERTSVGVRAPRFAAGATAAIVASVAPDTPAAAAGFAPGDRIVRIEEDDVAGWDECLFLLGTWRPGSVVRVSVRTAGAAEPVARLLALP